MTAQKRQCINCRYYEDAHLAASGHCTHPERQSNSTLRLMVRNRELACRNSWGGDLFVGKDADDDASQPDPAPHAPYREDAPDSAPLDDEVTSVVTPPLTRSPNGSTPVESGEDRVVSDLPAPRRDNRFDADEVDDGKNDPARQDQDERARVIARDPAAAIARARALHLNRKREGHTGNNASEPVSDDPDPDDGASSGASVSGNNHSGAEQVVSQHQRLSQRFTRKVATEARRSGHDQLVPRSEVEHHTERSNARRDRFDSVPEIDPNFDLPGLRRDSQRGTKSSPSPVNEDLQTATERHTPAIDDHVASEEDSTDTSPGSDATEDPPAKTLEHVLSRARRIRESKKQSRPHVHHFAVPANPPDDETADPLDRDQHLATHTRTRYPETALPPLADDFADGYSDVQEVEPEDAGRELHETHGQADHGQVRQSWLARFGINRAPALENELAADREDRDVDAYEDETSSVYADHDASVYADPEPAGQAYGFSSFSSETRWQAEVTPGPDRIADNGYHRSPDGYGYPDTHSVDTYNTDRDEYMDHVPSGAWSTTDHHSNHAVLPDIDEFFANASLQSSSPAEHDAGRSQARTRQQMQPAQDTRSDPEHHPVASRWSADAPSTPRESFFRARRFDEWDEQHPERWRLDDTSDFSDAPDSHRNDLDERGGSLPDIAADSFDLRDIIERGGELMDMRVDIAPDIPRACRTCRSFRSADGGARGWCTNEWAFTHRRMVNEDDVACETTIGSWWLPDDRYWMAEDLDYWSDATPRMDAFMARGTRAPRRKISGE